MFETQEGFTRSFKKLYDLPLGQYRLVMKNLIRGDTFLNKKSLIKDWIFSGNSIEKYDVLLTDKEVYKNKRSVTIYSTIQDLNEDDFVILLQQVNAKNYIILIVELIRMNNIKLFYETFIKIVYL